MNNQVSKNHRKPISLNTGMGLLRASLAAMMVGGCTPKETEEHQVTAITSPQTRYSLNHWRKDLLPLPVELESRPEILKSLKDYATGRIETEGGSNFDLNTTPDQNTLYSLLMTSGFYGQKVPKLIQEIAEMIGTGKFDKLHGMGFEESANAILGYIYDNPEVSEDFRKRFFDGKKMQCTEFSAIYAATLIALSPYRESTNPVQVSVICGLYADQDLAPQGVGHAWVHYAGYYFDPSLTREGQPLIMQPQDQATNYVPISGYYLIIDPVEHRLLNEGSIIFWDKGQ